MKKLMVHVLVARAFLGECPAGYEHNHKDGNKRNARPDNIEFVTPSENQHHRFDVLGVKLNQGSKNGRHKLTDDEAIRILNMRHGGLTQTAVASQFGVSVSTVSMLWSGRTWRHLHHLDGPTVPL